jgi:SAM-dependent methyltransferase
MRAWRSELLRDAHGRVLELGAGTGLNLDCYPTDIESLTLVEPDARMRRRLQRKVTSHRLAPRCTILDLPGESLALQAATFDVVVATLVLCSVRCVPIVLDQARRVLCNGGRLLSIEHIAAPPGTARSRAQVWLEPAWKCLAGGCHLRRDPRAYLPAAGFAAEVTHELEILGVPAFMKSGLVSRWVAT